MRKKKSKVVVTLTAREARMLREWLPEKRNELARRGGPTEDLDEILLRMMKQ